VIPGEGSWRKIAFFAELLPCNIETSDLETARTMLSHHLLSGFAVDASGFVDRMIAAWTGGPIEFSHESTEWLAVFRVENAVVGAPLSAGLGSKARWK
jgi:hypothetical protein